MSPRSGTHGNSQGNLENRSDKLQRETIYIHTLSLYI